ncbi:MAG: SOS response-associated peptidase [Chloroflexota bacterium]|nr:SOS response-associated peptidase [Chloroflexota bacterium]
MCGRFSIFADPDRLAEWFDAALPEEGLRPRYNAAPTQKLPVITNDDSQVIQLFRWGLVPFWAKGPGIGNRLINARSETVAEKPAYRAAFKHRRCLVLADGFYEWQKTSGGKVPMRIVLKSGDPFAFAGLWETWTPPEGDPLRTFTIITTTPNELLAPIHNRMPVILQKEHEAIWLDDAAEPTIWLDMLRAYPAGEMTAYPVSTLVNRPVNDDPSVVARVERGRLF